MLFTKIGNLDIDYCIYNASGVKCITNDHLNKLSISKSGVILSKSSTINYRPGNKEPRYWDNSFLSINSSGLPNLGFDFYNNYKNDNINKPYFISISGMSIENNITMINNLNSNIDGIELNLSCPNIKGHSQTGYDFVATEHLLRKSSEILDNKHSKFVFGIKLPPYFDDNHFNSMADIINEYSVTSITCINSLGNGLVVDYNSESTLIKPKNGFGGIGGSIIKPIALSNVHKFFKLTKCSVIGCGGIQNGKDAFEHILCGASAVQIGTTFYREDVECFTRIGNELKQIMIDKNYNSINDFKGNLKYL